MSWTWDNRDISGYGSGQTAFGPLFAAQNSATKNALFDNVITPAFDAEQNPADGRFVHITVVGHSDRVDTSGLTSEQRREQELKASQERAVDAKKWVFDQVCELILAAGGVVPNSAVDTLNFAVLRVESGAADLKNKVPADETERKANRRVAFLTVTFTP